MHKDRQTPGILKTLTLSSFNSVEQRIIENVSKTWFITFCKSTIFKGRDYSFFFGKATDDIAEQFHFSREVLFLFTSSQHFQARSLDFVDKLMSDYQNRLDKLCVFIISGDLTIEKQIASVLLQDKESRIIVPFTYIELSNDLSCEIQIDRLRSSFYERDLFAYETPLKTDTYFFGRQNTIHNIYGKYQTGQCASLFGLRRIGKTSVLYAILRMTKMREEPSVYIDCSETTFHFRRWNESLYLIISELNKSLLQEVDLQLCQEVEYTPRDASKCFESDLIKISSHFGNKRILIMLDEIENITFDISPSKHWNSDLDFIFFWQSIRSIFQKKPDLFSLIISGVNPKSIETPTVNKYDNPIYRFITPFYLPFFNQKEVEDMVGTIGSYMGMTFDDEVFTYLTDDFGGHPFLIRLACSKLFQSKKGRRQIKTSKFIYENQRETLNKSVSDYLDLIVSVLIERYPEEYDLIELLASGDQTTFNEFYNMSDKFVEHLIGYGLIATDGTNFHFTIKSIKDHINENSRIKSLPKSSEEKWQRICALRNALERDLRNFIKQNLKFNLGVEKAKERFVSIISPDSRKKLLTQSSYNDIFNGHLYFSDLEKVIEKEWVFFEGIFKDKGKFRQYIQFINSHRADAHANEISNEDMAILEISVDWLSGKIKDYIE